MDDELDRIVAAAMIDIAHERLECAQVAGAEISDDEDSVRFSGYLIGIDGDEALPRHFFSEGYSKATEKEIDDCMRDDMPKTGPARFERLVADIAESDIKTVAILMRIVRADGKVGFVLYHHPLLTQEQAGGLLICGLEAGKGARLKIN